jgi:uncharacterized protein (TIGR02594 family)
MGDSPLSDFYLFFRRAWAQGRWLTLLWFIPIAVFALVLWGVLQKTSEGVASKISEKVVEGVITWLPFRGETILRVVPPGMTPWLEVAHREIGQREMPGQDNNSRVMEYISAVRSTHGLQDDDVDWASPFVEWTLNQTNIRGPKTMRPRDWLNWGRIVDPPQRGCIIVLDLGRISHVGFYLEDLGASHKVLGGNQSDVVSISLYHRDSFLGCRMPP